MPARFLTPETQPSTIDRIQHLNADTPRLWGKMTAAQMIAHLLRSVEVSLEEVRVPDRGNFITRSIVKPFAFQIMTTWPKGRIATIPDYLPKPGADFPAERDRLVAAVNRFVNESSKNPARQTSHPMFGPVTMQYWRRIHGTHFEHHLRQFGA